MGSYNGAGICELIGVLILNHLEKRLAKKCRIVIWNDCKLASTAENVQQESHSNNLNNVCISLVATE